MARVARCGILSVVVSLPLWTATSSCANKEPAASPPATPDVAPAPSASPSATAAAEPEPAHKRRPFEVYSSCGDVVTVVFGDDPKAAKAGGRTIAPSAAIDGPRDNDGNQTVWLLDTNGEPLIKVRVTRGMKRVEVGKSCRTLDAH